MRYRAIVCDKCYKKENYQGYQSFEAALEEAKGRGWALSKWRDLCPSCNGKSDARTTK